MIWLLAVAATQFAEVGTVPSAPRDRQPAFDADGARIARALNGSASGDAGEPASVQILSDHLAEWHPVSDADMLTRCGSCALPGYRFHRRVTSDLDQDGRMDVVEMVTNGREDGLLIRYGAGGRTPRMVQRSSDRRWSDQGLFAVGAHSVFINQPEVNGQVLIQRGEQIRIIFIGD